MVKIKDIAIKCQTSTATVSKALHNSPELSKETIERIQKAAKEMGYVPDAYAQALKIKHSYSIGVIYHIYTLECGLKHEYFSTILDALKVQAESKGYAITFLSQSSQNNMSYYQNAKFRNMDGVIVVAEDYSDPEIVELVNSGMPVVTIDYLFSACSSVMSDNDEGMAKLVNYAASLNHRKIAYIFGEQTPVTKKRIASFYRGLKENGIEERPEYMIQAKYHDPKSAGRATKELLELNDKPTCIFYPDDVSLLGGYTAIQEAGLRVPEDISIVGYDGVEISRMFRPKMTTYIQDSKTLGTKAAQLLIERIEEPKLFIPQQISVQGEIQKGMTLAEAKK